MKRIITLLSLVLATSLLFAQTIKQGDVSVELLRDHNTVVIESMHNRYSTIYAVDYQDPEVSLAYLDKSEVGGSGRGSKSFQRQNAPKQVKVTDKDYVGSGFDRGHMIPNDMFNFDEDLAKDTFAIYNICPQWHNTNADSSAWYVIEQQIEKRAWSYGRVYVITGPVFDKDFYEYDTMGNRDDIVIPEKFYKVLISYDTEKQQFVKIEAYVFEHKQKNSEKNPEKCLISTLNFDETLKIIERDLKLKITLNDDSDDGQASTSTKSSKKKQSKKK